MNLVEYAEKVSPFPLADWQKNFWQLTRELKKKEIFV